MTFTTVARDLAHPYQSHETPDGNIIDGGSTSTKFRKVTKWPVCSHDAAPGELHCPRCARAFEWALFRSRFPESLKRIVVAVIGFVAVGSSLSLVALTNGMSSPGPIASLFGYAVLFYVTQMSLGFPLLAALAVIHWIANSPASDTQITPDRLGLVPVARPLVSMTLRAALLSALVWFVITTFCTSMTVPAEPLIFVRPAPDTVAVPVAFWAWAVASTPLTLLLDAYHDHERLEALPVVALLLAGLLLVYLHGAQTALLSWPSYLSVFAIALAGEIAHRYLGRHA